VGIDRKIGEGISGVEGEIHQRTSIDSIRLGQKMRNGSRCIRLCYRRGIIYGMQRWEIEASSISFKISK